MKLLLIFQFFIFLFFSSATALAQSLDTSYAPTIGGGSAHIGKIVRRADGKFVIAGNFEILGNVRKDKIALLGSDWTVDSSFDAGSFTRDVPQSTDPSIYQVEIQPDNKLIIYGSYTHINGVAVKSLLRLNADGSMDNSFSIAQGFNSNISVIKLLSSGKILVGGYFNSFNGQAVPSLIRLNADGSLDQSFFAEIVSSGFQHIDNFAVQPDGKIIALGDIFSTTGADFWGIARLNENGSFDNSFNPGSGASSYVFSLKILPDGKILIGGQFTSYNGVSRMGHARLNANGSLDTSFTCQTITVGGVTVNSAFFSIQDNGQIIIGGSFDRVNGIERKRIARINADGSLDTSFAPVIDNNEISSPAFISDVVIFPDQTMLVNGGFSRVNQDSRFNTAKLNPNGTTDSSFVFNTGKVGFVYSMALQPDGKLIVGGSFRQVGGIPQHAVTRLNPDGSVDSTFNTGNGFWDIINISSSYSVFAVALQNDGKILFGGNFRTYNDVVRSNLARVNSDGSIDSTFPALALANTVVYDVTIQPDNKILVASDQGNLSKGVFRLNADGTKDTNFNVGTGANNQVRRVSLQPDGKIIIAGSFTTFNGVSRNRIARLNADGSLDTTFDPGSGANSFIRTAAIQPDGKILIGGFFTTFNGTTQNRLARLNADGSLDTTFNTGTGADGGINKILLQSDGGIIIGGEFNNFAGINRKKLARVTSSGSLDQNFGSGLEWYAPGTFGASIHSLAGTNQGLIAGGNFTRIGSRNSSSLAKLSLSKQTMFDFDGDRRTDISIFRPSVGEWWYLRSSDGGNYAAQFGNSSDKIIPADFTGDGRTDIAVWRPSSGEWFILRSEDGSYYSFPFGTAGDIPAVGDFDGDGRADQAIFRPAETNWYVRRSSDSGFTIQQFGANGDVPAVADYDGDGKSDIAIWRASVGEWWMKKSSDNSVIAFQFGNSSDKPVQGDYTGDGKDDVAIFRPSTGEWFILRSEDYSYYSFPFGTNGDIPAPGGFDGDGRFDAAIFRPSGSTWYVQRSTAGTLIQSFGITGDVPVPNAFVP